MPEEAKVHLRFGFVELLFALTAAEVAIQFADIYSKAGASYVALPAYAHLVLALVIVAASWVGWSISNAPGARRDVHSIFSVDFLILLIDVLLVIFYFIVVKAVDPVSADSLSAVSVKAAATSEALWISVIFGGYLVWDFLTKAIVVQEASGKTSHSFDLRGTFLRRGWMSGACFALAVLAWYFAKEITVPIYVVVADMSLLSLVLLFRALKQGSYRLSWFLFIAFAVSLFFGYIEGR